MALVGLPELMEILSRLGGQAVQVHTERCARGRHRKSTCTRCADVCPTGAISWAEGLAVDPDKCTGCGACAAICPTGALEASSPADGELLARARQVAQTRKTVAFACPRYVEAGPGARAACVEVSCIGRLHEAVLVGAVATGAQWVLLLDGACEGCPSAKAHEVAERMVARANGLLQAFGVSSRVSLGPQLPASLLAGGGDSAEGLSRRGFFTLLARETVRLGAVTVDTVLSGRERVEKAEPTRGELPADVPAKRALLLASLKRLGEPAVARLETEGWATFGHTESCTGCQMCAFFCLTGALTKVEGEGKVGVAFRASACTACGLCVDICYQDAVTLAAGADVRKVLSDEAEAHWMRGSDEAPWQQPATDRIAKSIWETLEL